MINGTFYETDECRMGHKMYECIVLKSFIKDIVPLFHSNVKPMENLWKIPRSNYCTVDIEIANLANRYDNACTPTNNLFYYLRFMKYFNQTHVHLDNSSSMPVVCSTCSPNYLFISWNNRKVKHLSKK